MEKRSRKKDKNKENVVASAVEKEKKKAGITELDFKQLRICLQQILNKINGLMLPLIKNCKNDKAAMFLSCLATDICVGLSSWVDADNDKGYEENADKVELQHLFDVLRENKRWMQCHFAYNRAKEKGITVNLKTFMNAMLRPDDIETIMGRVQQKKSGLFSTKESKEEFMSGYFGRGIILIAISLIKQSWWLVLKTNFERIQKENARRNSFIEALENEKTLKEREELMKKNNGWSND